MPVLAQYGRNPLWRRGGGENIVNPPGVSIITQQEVVPAVPSQGGVGCENESSSMESDPPMVDEGSESALESADGDQGSESEDPGDQMTDLGSAEENDPEQEPEGTSTRQTAGDKNPRGGAGEPTGDKNMEGVTPPPRNGKRQRDEGGIHRPR